MSNVVSEFFANLFLRPAGMSASMSASMSADISVKLDRVLTRLDEFQQKEETFMSAIDDLKTSFQRLSTDVANEIRALGDSLQRQSSSPTEADLQQMATQANSLADRLEASVSGIAQSTATPVISGITPTSGAPGTTVTITGSGFGASAGQVTFGGTPASVQNWSDNSLTAVVPGSATDGTVVVIANGVKSNTQQFTIQAPAQATPTPAAPAPGTPGGGTPSTPGGTPGGTPGTPGTT